MTKSEKEQVATILTRRANEIAGYSEAHRESIHHPNREAMPASVEYALELEMKRLRRLAELVNPPALEVPEQD